MRSVVTGAAGFIGSHLAERLLARGHEVIGIDCLTPFYDTQAKRANLCPLLASRRFQFVQADLTETDLRPLLAGADFVFHQAAQPGVQPSWDGSFARYAACNIVATQRLLEAARGLPLRKLVYASSSSVYGNACPPMRETAPPHPISPYGVSKLAAEHLCMLYCEVHGVPAIALRYFTVYGPRQRPDMAIHRFIHSLLNGEPITLYGDGAQQRDFTYVDDVVDANLRAALSPALGITVNVGGGSPASLLETLALLEEVTGCRARVERACRSAGDVAVTTADTARARLLLGFTPHVPLQVGLRRQVAWQRESFQASVANAP